MANCEGDRVAKYAGENLHQIVKKQEAFAKEDYVKALQDGFIATDTALLDGVFLFITYHVLTHQTGLTRTSHPAVPLPPSLSPRKIFFTWYVFLRKWVLNSGKCRRFTDSAWSERTCHSVIKRS